MTSRAYPDWLLREGRYSVADATGYTGDDRTARTAGHRWNRYVLPTLAAGASLIPAAAGTYNTWRSFVPNVAAKAAGDASSIYQSVVGESADEQMHRNEDKGTTPSKAVVQHNVSETKKGVEQDG